MVSRHRHSLLELAISHPVTSTLTLAVLYITYKLVLKPVLYPSPYRHLPAPERASYLLGQRIVEAKGLSYVDADGTTKTISGPGEVCKYYSRTLASSVFVFPEPLGGETLYIADPHALNHILSDIDTFQSDLLRSSIIVFIVGDGIVTRYENAHRRQRRLMAPAFTATHMKELTPIFCKYGDLMCQKIEQTLVNDTATVDLAEWLDCVMLDIIGMAGFGYECLALDKGRSGSELSAAFNSVNQAAIDFGLGRAVHLGLSALLYPKACTWPVSDANRRIAKVNRVMESVTMEIVRDARQKVDKEGDDLQGKKDLLSLLMKGNQSGQSSETMTDEEISGQIRTFFFAGYETSSVTTSWVLYFLSRHSDIQRKLRKIIDEVVQQRKGVPLHELQAEDLAYDDIWSDDLRYLDWVVSETLRLCPPVPGNDREARQDAVLPLMNPITAKDGTKVSQLVVKKGARLTIGIKTINYDPRFFGPDADDFRPERWGELPEAHAKAKFPPYGIYSFIGGPKSWYVEAAHVPFFL